MGSVGEPFSNQSIGWCCIDRLNRHDAGSKTVAESEIAVMLGWLIEKGSVRFGNQACGVLGSFFGCAFVWTLC